MAISVKLFGGAKKAFPNYAPNVQNRTKVTVSDILQDMVQSLPPDTPVPDTKNVLIAINGVDSSALNGRDTILKDGDVVSIIPVIHGGSDSIRFTIPPYEILAFCAKIDYTSLDKMRQEYPALHIQAINPDYILGESHLRRILEISITSEKNNELLSNTLEIDILQRLAGTTQISRAIKMAGATASTQNTPIIISLGKPDVLRNLLRNVSCEKIKFSKNQKTLEKTFHYTKLHKKAGYALEDILVESASILRQ